MSIISIIPSYFFWHYTFAFKCFFAISGNFLRFIYEFFSIPDLMRTLFSGWHRIKERYPKGLDIGAFFSSLLVNFIMIIFGFILRTVVILIGLFFLLVLFLLEVSIFAVWILLPLVIPISFFAGVSLIF